MGVASDVSEETINSRGAAQKVDLCWKDSICIRSSSADGVNFSAALFYVIWQSLAD